MKNGLIRDNLGDISPMQPNQLVFLVLSSKGTSSLVSQLPIRLLIF